jgi:hypothetical protein
MTTTTRRTWAIIAAALTATLLTTPAASAFVIGPGRDPGLAVDASGTAYIAWNGPENASTLRFCRLPRAATVCDAGTTTSIAVPADTTAGSRPFVAVVGSRVSVVLYRYPLTGQFMAGNYVYTSPDRGAHFGAGVKVGSVPYFEAIVGPGDAMSGVTQAGPTPMTFQRVPLNGSPGPDLVRASLSETHLLYSSVGLIDASTPLAVFGDGNGDSEFRRYDGSGDVNDGANWTAAVGIGPLSYPKLAGGPKGLFLLSGDGNGNLFARKWNGTNGFGAAATVGPGSTPSKHLFQDAGGRLHAAFQRDNANPLQVVHAVSDDGVTWRSGTVVRQDIGTDGGLDSFRVAAAPDHIGVIAYHAGLGAGDVRVVAVGPDAPVDPVTPPPPFAPPPPAAPTRVTKPKPKFTTSGSAKRAGRRIRIRIKGKLVLPTGVAKAIGCTGKIKVTITRARKPVASKTVNVKKSCEFRFSATVARSKVKRAKKLAIRLRFTGNNALAARTKLASIKVKR